MVYAWYFPKKNCAYRARKRHDWVNMVLWIDNPALETPKIHGASLSQQTLELDKLIFIPLGERKKEPYQKVTQISSMGFVGTHEIRHTRIGRWSWNYTYEGGSNVSTRVFHTYPDQADWIALSFSHRDGTYHDLIMWEQLTDNARQALSSADFGEAKVLFNENNFEMTLEQAWPF